MQRITVKMFSLLEMASKPSEKPIFAPSRLSEIFTVFPFN